MYVVYTRPPTDRASISSQSDVVSNLGRDGFDSGTEAPSVQTSAAPSRKSSINLDQAVNWPPLHPPTAAQATATDAALKVDTANGQQPAGAGTVSADGCVGDSLLIRGLLGCVYM